MDRDNEHSGIDGSASNDDDTCPDRLHITNGNVRIDTYSPTNTGADGDEDAAYAHHAHGNIGDGGLWWWWWWGDGCGCGYSGGDNNNDTPTRRDKTTQNEMKRTERK